jgi:mannose-6-phosphate isomerase-like protein (cupin superfamily)
MFNNDIKFKLFTLRPIKTEGKPGELIDVDIKQICLENDLQFNISKCFYINELNSNLPRGNHSNFNASEILICLKGSFEIILHDGHKEYKFTLNKNDAIFINKNIWIQFYNFKNCIIMAFVNIITNNTQITENKSSCYEFDEFLLNCT